MKTRNLTCKSCGKDFINEYTGKGRPPVFCVECKSKKEDINIHKNSLKSKTNIKKDKVIKTRQYVCSVCKKTYQHTKIGRLPVTCESCRSEKQSKLEKNQKIRKFLCEVCDKEFTYEKKGRLPHTCTECKQKQHLILNPKKKEKEQQNTKHKIVVINNKPIEVGKPAFYLSRTFQTLEGQIRHGQVVNLIEDSKTKPGFILGRGTKNSLANEDFEYDSTYLRSFDYQYIDYREQLPENSEIEEFYVE